MFAEKGDFSFFLLDKRFRWHVSTSGIPENNVSPGLLSNVIVYAYLHITQVWRVANKKWPNPKPIL